MSMFSNLMVPNIAPNDAEDNRIISLYYLFLMLVLNLMGRSFFKLLVG